MSLLCCVVLCWSIAPLFPQKSLHNASYVYVSVIFKTVNNTRMEGVMFPYEKLRILVGSQKLIIMCFNVTMFI